MKNCKLEVRVSEKEKEMFLAMAKQEGTTTSVLLRKMIREVIGEEKDIPEIIEVDKQKKNRIQFRLSNAEYLKITALAEKANLTISEYIRKRSLNEEIKIVHITALKEFVFQLRKLGTNINHLTQLANAGRIYALELSSTEQGIKEIWKSINRLLEQQQKGEVD